MDPVQLTIIAISFVLTLLLVLLGAQVWYILKEIRIAIGKTNTIIDDAKKVTGTVGDSVSSMSGVASGIKAALSVFKSFRKKNDDDDE
ncbi:MAG TPA: hypothetical protein VJB96_05475 [Patescibacteria group bacterium]|nr:hypothetical protein [Patescibacteria group bacterium]